MQVSEKVKSAYKADGTTKYLTITFPELDLQIEPKDIHQESQTLTESIFNKDSIEFVGCIASKYGIKINGLKADVKNKKIIVDSYTEDTEDEPVRLFYGIVDSAKKTSNKQVKEIVAYDELYTKGNVDVSAWYKSLPLPMTLKDIRDSLFRFLGIEQEDADLPNDGIMIDRQYDPNTMQSLVVMKSICQINGAFGIMSRYGKFAYRIMGDIYDDGTYPGVDCFPGPTTFPGADTAVKPTEIEETGFTYYENVNYEEFNVKPVDKVTVRQSDDDPGVTYGIGGNNYIVQGNMFTYGLSKSTLAQVAENIYNAVQGFSYYPYEAKNNGLPFVECGLNTVSYMMVDYDATYSDENTSGDIIYEEKKFPILYRNMTGIQALRDNYSAKGEEYQSEFVTDLQAQIDLLKRNDTTKQYVDDKFKDYDTKFDDFAADYYDKSQIDDMFASGGGGGFNVESVAELPAIPDSNTIYLIQGVVVVE